MKLCHAPTKVIGAEPCPRRHGHRGPCFWWLAFECGGEICAIVYSGDPQERVRRARGRFLEEPTSADVARLLETIGELRQREIDRRERQRRNPQPVAGPWEDVPWSPDVAPGEEPPAMVVRPSRPEPVGTASDRAARMAARRARAAGNTTPIP